MDYAALRNFKDFLQVYNIMSEVCFLRCVDTLNTRNLTPEEVQCTNLCTEKYISMNNRLMQLFMEIQPVIVNKRIEEMSKNQQALEAAAAKQNQENSSDIVAVKNEIEETS